MPSGPLGVVGDALVSRSPLPEPGWAALRHNANARARPHRPALRLSCPPSGANWQAGLRALSLQLQRPTSPVARARELEGPSLMMRGATGPGGGLRIRVGGPGPGPGPRCTQAANLNAGPTGAGPAGPSRHGSRRGPHAAQATERRRPDASGRGTTVVSPGPIRRGSHLTCLHTYAPLLTLMVHTTHHPGIRSAYALLP